MSAHLGRFAHVLRPAAAVPRFLPVRGQPRGLRRTEMPKRGGDPVGGGRERPGRER